MSVSTYDKDTNSSSNPLWTSTYSYDSLGKVTQVRIVDGQPRTITFKTDFSGQVLSRVDVNDSSSISGSTTVGPKEYTYFFDGSQMGEVGSNGTMNVDYGSWVARRYAPKLQSGATNGYSSGTTPTAYGDFDTSFDRINGASEGWASSSYTVRDGDTLQSIAEAVWGDASMWYMLAEANGLSGTETLVGRTQLIVPNRVTNIHNTSDTFRVYDPNKAMGDLSPTSIKPIARPSGCATVGRIVLMAVAIAITAWLAPQITPWVTQLLAAGAAPAAAGVAVVTGTTVAAGSLTAVAGAAISGAVIGVAASAVTQGLGVAMKLQSGFSWKQLGMAAITGAVGGAVGAMAKGDMLGALGKQSFVGGAARGVISSAASQGIGVATRLQKKFDWAGVAVAGVAGGIASHLEAKWGMDAAHPDFATVAAARTIGGVASAAIRSGLTGTSFAQYLEAVLPDIIGGTIGDMAAGAIIQAELEKQAKPQAVAKRMVESASRINGPESATDEWKALAKDERQYATEEIEEIRRLADIDPKQAQDRQRALVAHVADTLLTSDQGQQELRRAQAILAAPKTAQAVPAEQAPDTGAPGPSTFTGGEAVIPAEAQFNDNIEVVGHRIKHGTAIHPLIDWPSVQIGRFAMKMAGKAAEVIDKIPGAHTALELIDWGVWIAGGPVKMVMSSAYNRLEGKLVEKLTERFADAGYGDDSAAGGIGVPVLATLIASGVGGVLGIAGKAGLLSSRKIRGERVTQDPAPRPTETPSGRTRLPRSNGRWEGTPGDGLWYSSKPAVNAITGGRPIPFVNGRPDFSAWSKGEITFKKGMLTGEGGDFDLVYDHLKEERGLSSRSAARAMLKQQEVTFHHSTSTTVQFVPRHYITIFRTSVPHQT